MCTQDGCARSRQVRRARYPAVGPFIAFLALAAAGVSLVGGGEQSWQEPVQEDLRAIIAKTLGPADPDADPDPKEGELLMLTAKYRTPEERAAIYAAIVELRSNTLRKWGNAWKIVGYAQKALEHTADLQDRCRLYVRLGEAFGRPIGLGEVSKDEFPEARTKAAVPYLRALAIVAEKLRIKEYDERPTSWGVRETEPPLTNPRHKEWVEWANKRVDELRKEWDLQEYLLAVKGPLIEQLARRYSTPPYATEELRGLATEIVKKPEMVKEIMDAVEAKIKEDEAKAPAKGEKPAGGAVPPKAEEAPPGR